MTTEQRFDKVKAELAKFPPITDNKELIAVIIQLVNICQNQQQEINRLNAHIKDEAHD